jgi:hypothetical protein
MYIKQILSKSKQLIQTVVVFSVMNVVMACRAGDISCQRTPCVVVNRIYVPTETKWERFVEALETVESGNRTDAVGKRNDVGVLQITPVYVAEVNRILGKQEYTLADRYDRQKSREMFETMQSHYNPTRSIRRAIELHNSRAPQSYYDKIISKMKSI